MPNGTHDVQLRALEKWRDTVDAELRGIAPKLYGIVEWRNHVDNDLSDIKALLGDTRREVRAGLQEVRDDVSTISRHVGRPLLSWPQTLTLAIALVGTVLTFGAIAG